MSKTSYPLVTRLAVAGALLEFFACAVWMLCEQYVERRAIDWGLRDHIVISSTLLMGATFGMFVTPVLLIKGLFIMKRNDCRLADALRPFIWHVGLASAALALPWIYIDEIHLGNLWTLLLILPPYVFAFYAGQFHAGGFWTILLALPAYIIAFRLWLKPSTRSA